MGPARTARTFAATLLAGTAIGTAAGPAAAAPPGGALPEGRGVQEEVTGSAFASLGSAGSDLGVFLSVFQPPGEPAFALPEVFVAGYECFLGEFVDATLDGLDEATAWGTTTLQCSGDGLPDTEAVVDVDVRWTGVGRTMRTVVAGPHFPCVSRTAIREAEISGSVHVSIPDLGIDTTVTEGFGDVRRTRSVCPPGRS